MPKKSNSHEKCILMLMNELFSSCSYLKERFPKYRELYDKVEKLRTSNKEMPDKNITGAHQTKNDEIISNIISRSE